MHDSFTPQNHAAQYLEARDPFIRRKAAAQYLGVSIPTLDRWMARGKIPQSIKISPGCTGWRKSTLDKFIDQHVREPQSLEAAK